MKYWGKEEEEAIINFNMTDNIDDKHVIYYNVIEPAFKQLVENIYYTFNFNRTLYDFDTIKHEATTHLYEKLAKYDVTRNKKSYSYFGTIVKNWLIQQSNSYKKRVFIDEDSNDLIVSELSIDNYYERNVELSNVDLIDNLKEEFYYKICNNNDLSDDDIKVLDIILEILNCYDKIYIGNKKQLYVYIREATDLPSRKITKSINKIKKIYSNVKIDFIEE